MAAVLLALCWPAGGAEKPLPPPPDPAVPVDYIAWLNRENRCLQNNAFDDYLAAYERLTSFEAEWGDTLTRPWSNHAAVSSWLQTNHEALVIFCRAAGRSDYCFRLKRNRELAEPRVQALLLAWEKPGWRGHLDAAKGMLAAGWRAWRKGDEGLLLKNAVTVLRAAHHLQGVPWPIARLIGDGTATPAYIALRRGLALARDPAAWAASLKTALEQDDPPALPFSHACSLLRFEFWDLCQRVFLPHGPTGPWPVHRGVIRDLNSRIEGEPEALAERLAEIGLAASLAESDAYYFALERWNGLPYHLAAAEPFPLDTLLRSSTNPLVQLQAQLTVESRAKVERTAAQRRATHLVVYLLIHQARYGTFPDRLGQLAVADLETLRIDPFSGKDFMYHQRGDDFVLYSLAYNLTNDSGRHDPEWKSLDYVFWPVER